MRTKREEVLAEFSKLVEEAGEVPERTWTCQCNGQCKMAFLLSTNMIVQTMEEAALGFLLGKISEETLIQAAEIANTGIKRHLDIAATKTVAHTQKHAHA